MEILVIDENSLKQTSWKNETKSCPNHTLWEEKNVIKNFILFALFRGDRTTKCSLFHTQIKQQNVEYKTQASANINQVHFSWETKSKSMQWEHFVNKRIFSIKNNCGSFRRPNKNNQISL